MMVMWQSFALEYKATALVNSSSGKMVRANLDGLTLASERAFSMKHRELDERGSAWRGVTPNEFICVSIGLMVSHRLQAD
eukprot:scaffold596913_cov39-Prasinocladus_malaysianus.AAC.1